MSRRQTLPPFAHERLAEVARRLRAAPATATDRANENRIMPGLGRDSFELGWLQGETRHAADDIEAVLAAYAPAPKKGGG